MERLMKDRICRYADLQWFEETMQQTVNEQWPDLVESLHPHFVTFPVDARMYQRPVTTMSKKEMKVRHFVILFKWLKHFMKINLRYKNKGYILSLCEKQYSKSHLSVSFRVHVCQYCV